MPRATFCDSGRRWTRVGTDCRADAGVRADL